MESAFMDKSVTPDTEKLANTLNDTYPIWSNLKDFLYDKLSNPGEEWNYPGKKYGWSFRVKSGKRNIIYFLPRVSYFQVAFVFGKHAYESVLGSDINDGIKKDLQEARVYAEGRGVRIDVKNSEILNDVKKLVKIKVDN